MSALLTLKGITKRFGGLVAVDNVSFCIEENRVHSIIGPNGAGKTTLLNILFGIFPPTSGSVAFGARTISGLEPYQIAGMGVSRTFQNLQICLNMTALENVMLGAHKQMDTSSFRAMLRTRSIVEGDKKCRDIAEHAMQRVGLGQYVGAPVDVLPYGALKRLEIARALASDAKLLLLDEPAAGLNPRETEHIEEIIAQLRASGVTVVLVEHDMKLVMKISDTITVLDQGQLLTEGTPAQVRENPAVITAYLGKPHQDRSASRTAFARTGGSATHKAPANRLEVRNLETSYGQIKVLDDISMDVGEGELVALIGANGAGKSTLLRCIQGLQPLSAGTIAFDGGDISRVRADRRKHLGICQSPEGRQLFAPLSVEDNLRIGGYGRAAADVTRDMARMFETFPVLLKRRTSPAGMLSGGQQQMLSIARALMGNPRLLLLDEPSMGLAPTIMQEVFEIIGRLREQGTTILLVEQNAQEALSIADKGYVLEAGRIVLSGRGHELLGADQVRDAYLGYSEVARDLAQAAGT